MHLAVVSHACVTDINQQVYSEIEKLGHKVDLIVPSNFIAPGLTNEPIKVKRWPSFKGRIIEIPTFFKDSIPLHFYKKSLRKVLDDIQPDAIYVAEEPYSISCFQALRGALPMNKAVGFYSAQNIKKDYPFIFKKMERYVYQNASLAVSISTDVSTVLREKGYQNNICEIPLGVDEKHFYISIDQKQEAKVKLNIPDDAFVVGFAGRLVEEKGVDLLLEAINQVKTIIPNIHLIVVGRGPLLTRMKELVSEFKMNENVHFVEDAIHGEMPMWFNCMDVHVLPSRTVSNWREQFGRVLIEAAACGVPSIGSTCGEIPTVLKSIGMDSVFEEENVEELAEQLEKMYQNEINPNNIRKKTVEQYGNKGIASQLIKAFEEVI